MNAVIRGTCLFFCGIDFKGPHPDLVLSPRPINLTRRMDGRESRSVIGYNPLETDGPLRLLHQSLFFYIVFFINSSFRLPLEEFSPLLFCYPCCGVGSIKG